MKILLDNCVDTRAKVMFVGHEVQHVLDLGWEALSNGKLLAAASGAGFEAVVTVDKNIRHQQNLDRLSVSIIELNDVKNRLDRLSENASCLATAIDAVQRFRFVSIRSDGWIERVADWKL